MKKKLIVISLMLFTILSLAGCKVNLDSPSDLSESNVSSQEKNSITIAVAASLKNAVDDELIPLFNKSYPDIEINASYDSSGKLQSQIEEGALIDIFMSAGLKQVKALDEKNLILKDSIVELLENKIVLITPIDSKLELNNFEDILKANTVAIGDPESVPAGQYAREALTNLGIYEEVLKKSSLGTNVTEVLNWVAASSADAGIVYATDAVSNENVRIIASAPEESVSKVIYPVAIIESTKSIEESSLFIEFLQSNEAKLIFESYGFTLNK